MTASRLALLAISSACACVLGLWLVDGPEHVAGAERPRRARLGARAQAHAPPAGLLEVRPEAAPVRGAAPVPEPAEPVAGGHRQPAPLPPASAEERRRSLRVVSALDESPLPEAWCEAWSADSAASTPRLASADPRGALQLPGEGPWRVGAPGYATRIVSAEHAAPTLALCPSRGLELRVLAEGEPVARARVVVESDTWRRELTSDRLGRVRVEDAPSDEPLDVRVRALGYRSLDRVEPAGSDPLLRTLELERGAVLRGRVVDEEGRALPGAEVWAFAADALDAPQVIEANAAGEFELSGFSPDEAVAAFAFTPERATRVQAEWIAVTRERTLTLAPRAELRIEAPAPGTRLLPVGCSLPIPDRVRLLEGSEGDWARAARLPAGRYLLSRPGEEPREIDLQPGRVATIVGS